jgi:V/A-type H+-transporting ATPase subunit D
MRVVDRTPTQRNYLDLQEGLERVRQGHDLLEQKRQILVMELMDNVESARRIKEEIDQTMAAAYRALRKAAVRSGLSGLRRQNCGIVMEHALSSAVRSVMGVPVPEISCEAEEFGLEFGLTDGRAQTDEVLRRFLEALELVAELAQVENAVFRLAREVRRTQRRVNALEQIYVPAYQEALDYIETALAERRRQEFIVLRRVKRKRSRRRTEEMVAYPAEQTPGKREGGSG